MPEVRLIDANALLKKCIEGDGDNEFTEGYNFAVQEISAYIELAPTIEAEPVRHGRWIEVTKHRDENGAILNDYECSECFAMLKDSDSEQIKDERFCYNCGVRMDGGADNG